MKNLGKVILLTGIALLLIGTNDSWSQKSPSSSGRGESWFNAIDADGDGKISRDEHKKHSDQSAEELFTQMDVNKDGSISKDEFKEGTPRKRKKFNTIDANGDGKISRDEHKKHADQNAEERFTQMDKNKDGSISKDEFKEGIPKKRKKGKQKAKEQPKAEKK